MAGSPHDALFKHAFSDPESAAEELRVVLPPELAATLDFATLRLCPGTFVDDALSERHTDLLFTIELGGRPAFVYVLFEHQSRVDRLMAFRLLRYMVRIWERHLDEDSSAVRLPAILPVVLHHSEGGWSAATQFGELLDVSAAQRPLVGPYVPEFRFFLDDLSGQSDEAIRGRAMSAWLRLVLLFLRTARGDDLVPRLAGWASLLAELYRAPSGMQALATLLRYVHEVSDRDPTELHQALTAALAADCEEAIVTSAQILEERGRVKGVAEGLAKGVAEGLAKGVAEGLAKGILAVLAARGLPLDATTRERFVTCTDVPTLERWLQRAATASSVADVLQ